MLADQAYFQYRGQVAAIKRDWPNRITVLQQSTVSSYVLLALLDAYRGIKRNLETWAAVPGVLDVAKAAQQDTGYDVVAEYQAIRSALNTAIARITALWPQPNGFCAHESMSADGTRTPRTFTSAQVSQIVSDAQAVIVAANESPEE